MDATGGVLLGEQELMAAVRANSWLMEALRAARAVDPPQWWIGGGVLRDLMWDTRTRGFDPRRVKDVDLAFFDAGDLSVERETGIEDGLKALAPHIPWEARNQAAVHTWYHLRFGQRVEALASAAEGVATWPETATAVAVRLGEDDHLEVLASCGLQDLLGGVCRRNPRRVSHDEFIRRLNGKDFTRRWPDVRVIWES